MNLKRFIKRLGTASLVQMIACSLWAASYMADEGVAVFYPDTMGPENQIPSVAFIKALEPKGEVSPDWTLVPRFSQTSEPYLTEDFRDDHGNIPLRYRAHFTGMSKGVDLYGTGQQKGSLRRNGTVVPLYARDNFMFFKGDNLYSSHPWVMGVRPDGSSFGIFADSPARGEINLKDNHMIFDFEVRPFRVVVMEAQTPQALLKKLAKHTGTISMPPMWALGYQQCRYSYMNEKEGREIIDGFRTRNLPCDVIWFDIDYMKDFKVFSFDHSAFPDPQKMNDYAHQNGFKAVWMINPGVKAEDGFGIYDTIKRERKGVGKIVCAKQTYCCSGKLKNYLALVVSAYSISKIIFGTVA